MQVQGTVIWVPVLEADTVDTAESQATLWQDPPTRHVWDRTVEVNAQFARRLSLSSPGWDLYLIYDRGVRWEDDLPPAPTFWMHQLSPAVGADRALYLRDHPDRLEQVLVDLLAR
jgi:hypothetical protein